MNYRKLKINLAFVLILSALVFSQAHAASEVTGTLSAGASATGSGTGGTISGTVASANTGGGGGGGRSSGGGLVLGASTTNPIQDGQVLGAATIVPNFPTTGIGMFNYFNSILLILLLTLSLSAYGFYKRVRQS